MYSFLPQTLCGQFSEEIIVWCVRITGEADPSSLCTKGESLWSYWFPATTSVDVFWLVLFKKKITGDFMTVVSILILILFQSGRLQCSDSISFISHVILASIVLCFILSLRRRSRESSLPTEGIPVVPFTRLVSSSAPYCLSCLWLIFIFSYWEIQTGAEWFPLASLQGQEEFPTGDLMHVAFFVVVNGGKIQVT